MRRKAASCVIGKVRYTIVAGQHHVKIFVHVYACFLRNGFEFARFHLRIKFIRIADPLDKQLLVRPTSFRAHNAFDLEIFIALETFLADAHEFLFVKETVYDFIVQILQNVRVQALPVRYACYLKNFLAEIFLISSLEGVFRATDAHEITHVEFTTAP